MQDELDEATRGGRFAAIRAELGVSGIVYAERLNDAAEGMGLPRYWTGPKVTNTEKGKRDLSTEDALIVAKVDPRNRGWTWPMYGVPLKQGEDAYAVLARFAKKRKTG